MKIFLRWLLWLLLVLSLCVPFSVVITCCVEYPISTILCAVWGLGCGFIAGRLVF